MRRGLLLVVTLVAVVVGAIVAILLLRFPKVGPAPAMTVTSTPELVARGAYLANHVTVCIDCHSELDRTRWSLPVVAGTEGRGGTRFGEDLGFPGSLWAKNITPAALANWSDGEIVRAVGSGISRDGTALFPLMPYPAYRELSQHDMAAIVAYLRTLAPLANEVPARSLDFPFELIVRTIPQQATPPAEAPPTSDRVAYGRYLTTIAGCRDCHTPAEAGRPVAGKEFQGGQEFRFADGSLVRSANLTPDHDTGLGGWDRERFRSTFRRFTAENAPPVAPGGMNTVMPWTSYSGLTDDDLDAIWDYLGTLPATRNRVAAFQPAD